MEAASRKSIIQWLKRIERSKLSLREFFEGNDVPFSKARYSVDRHTLHHANMAAAGLAWQQGVVRGELDRTDRAEKESAHTRFEKSANAPAGPAIEYSH